MSPTLRSGRLPKASITMSQTTTKTTPPLELPRPNVYLLFVYPIVLSLGSLFSILSPIASPSNQEALAPGITSDLNTNSLPAATNYFADKHNLVNIFFVKRGWLWTTLVFILLQVSALQSSKSNKQKHSFQSAIRFVLVTFSWFLTTQWFFGPPLIDRSFTLTGGHCEAQPAKMGGFRAAEIAMTTSSTLCKASGGAWRGGHDISGHVFMLVLSSAFLLYELHLADRHSSHPSVSPQAAVNVAHDLTEDEKNAVGGWETEQIAKLRLWSRRALYAVVALDFWMLLMTAIWFHTWFEKLSGLALSGATLWAVYFLGDFVPEWREIVGGME